MGFNLLRRRTEKEVIAKKEAPKKEAKTPSKPVFSFFKAGSKAKAAPKAKVTPKTPAPTGEVKPKEAEKPVEETNKTEVENVETVSQECVVVAIPFHFYLKYRFVFPCYLFHYRSQLTKS